MTNRIYSVAGLIVVLLISTHALAAAPYHLAKTTIIPGETGWDYLITDDEARRVYVSHGTEVDVLDEDSGKIKEKISGLAGVHGIAIASDMGRGFISDGRANSVIPFDLKTLEKMTAIKTGQNPDSIIYDSLTHKVFAFNGDGGSVTIIDTSKNKVVATLPLGGSPEFATSDGAGHVFVNLEDKSQMVRIDSRHNQVLDHWDLAPCKGPASLAMDAPRHRLFAGCHNNILAVVNADTGKVVATPAIGDRVDATVFDAQLGWVITANGVGSMTIIHEDTPDQYRVADTVLTKKGSRTLALDKKTHRLYFPAADFKEASPATQNGKRIRPLMIPGSFSILIYDQG